MKFLRRSLFIKQKLKEIKEKGRLASLVLYMAILCYLLVLLPQDIVFENPGLRVFTLILLALSFSWCSYKGIQSMKGNPLPNREKAWEIGTWWISVFLCLMFSAYYLGLFRSDIWP